MNDTLPAPRLPKPPKGQAWYCGLVNVLRIPGLPSDFFEEGDAAIGAWVQICLTAPSIPEAEVALAEHVGECGADAGEITDLRAIRTPADLPGDPEGGPDEAIQEAFCDPELDADHVVWGTLYLYDTDDGD